MAENRKLIEHLDQALARVEEAKMEEWIKPDGESAHDSLERLHRDLASIRGAAERGEMIDIDMLAGLVRWVTDWVPELGDPLVRALGKAQQAAR